MELRPKISTLVTGLNFPEAPCFDSRSKLWFTEIKSSCLTYFDDGKLSRVVAGGNTNGMVFDAPGDIWFTDSQNHKLRKYLLQEKRFEDVLTSVENERLNRYADGRTEPRGFLVSLSTNDVAKVISRNKFFANGIVFSEDSRWLYFSETYKWRVWRASWDAVTATILNEVPWVETGGPIGPDGMVLDTKGNLYIAVFDQSRIAVLNPDGKIIETIPLPVKRPSSCAFDPSGRYRLVVTDADVGCVLSLDLGRKGAKLFYR